MEGNEFSKNRRKMKTYTVTEKDIEDLLDSLENSGGFDWWHIAKIEEWVEKLNKNNEPKIHFQFSQYEARKLVNCIARTSAKGEDLDIGIVVEDKLFEFLKSLEK